MDYGIDVIKKGDLASKELIALKWLTAGFPGEKIEKAGDEYLWFADSDVPIVAVPIIGNQRETRSLESGALFIENAAKFAKQHGLKAVALTDILEMSTIDLKEIIPNVKKGMYDAAKNYNIWIATGETAGHGNRVTVPFNISGLLLAYAPRSWDVGYRDVGGREAAVFKSEGKGVYSASDGVGTKSGFTERLYSLGRAVLAERILQDGWAMRFDDTVKANAKLVADSTQIELGRMDTNLVHILQNAIHNARRKHSALLTLDIEETNRIRGYGDLPISSSGSAVSLVDPEELKRLPVPKPGQYVLGLYNIDNRNLRCNGITDQREILEHIKGYHWHKEFGGSELLEAVSAPSTIFYHFFRGLFKEGLVSKVGHFSGGAYDGKFAKQLGKYGLGANLEIEGHSFPVQEMLVNIQLDYLQNIRNKGCTFEDICAKQPYRLEAWVVTDNPEKVIAYAAQHGLMGLNLGQTVAMEKPELSMTFKDRNETVRYSGVKG
jgi:phosphoribosylaminoimidazole (AIR) synthetase